MSMPPSTLDTLPLPRWAYVPGESAQICADLRCPNPYLGIESLGEPHEAWWLNVFATEADTGGCLLCASSQPSGGICQNRMFLRPPSRLLQGRQS